MNFKNLLDKINKAYSEQKPFVVYRKSNEVILKALFQNDSDVYFVNDYNEEGFIFAPFDTSEKSILTPLEKSEFLQVELEHQKLPVSSTKQSSSNFDNESDKVKHVNLVSKGIDFIQKGNATKVVLSRKENVELQNFSITKILKKLLFRYKNATVYSWFHPKVGLWFGATPETLFTVNNDIFKTMSLAATRSYVNTLEVVWDAKEMEEQQIVTDYIALKLKGITKDIQISKPFTVRAGNLVHLKSDIYGNLKERSDLIKILNELHPTPAVCGMPKIITKQFILKNEGYQREFYTGFLGELNINKCTSLFVNLRCMQLKNKEAYLYIGGGITKDSIAESEWQETVEKAKVMRKIIIN